MTKKIDLTDGLSKNNDTYYSCRVRKLYLFYKFQIQILFRPTTIKAPATYQIT